MMSQTENTKMCSAEIFAHDLLEEPCHINSLPPELLHMIHSYLDMPDKFRASRVCQKWHSSGCFPKDSLPKLAKVFLDFGDQLGWTPAVQKGTPLALENTIKNLENKLTSLTFPKITEFCFRCDEKVTDCVLATIAHWQRDVERAVLLKCPNISEAGIGHIIDLNLTCLILPLCSQMTDDTMARLAKSSQIQANLRELWIGGFQCDLTDQGLKHVAKIGSLTRLVLLFSFGDAAIRHLADGESKIQKLHLQYCSAMTNDVMRHVAGIHSLCKLNLGFMHQITQEGIWHLCHFGSLLTSINFSNCTELEGSMAHPLSNLVSLRALHLRENGVAPNFMEILVNGPSHVDTITMSDSVHINTNMSHLARFAPLCKLTVQHCSQLTVEGYSMLASGESKIQNLSVNPPDEAAPLLAKLVHLQTLNLSKAQIGQRFLEGLTAGRSNIATLNLSGCHNVNDVGMRHVSNLPALSKLFLAGCMVSEVGLSHLLDGLPKLKGLDVSGCRLLGEQTLTYIANSLLFLATLRMDTRHVTNMGMSIAACQLKRLTCFEVDGTCRMNDIKRLKDFDFLPTFGQLFLFD